MEKKNKNKNKNKSKNKTLLLKIIKVIVEMLILAIIVLVLFHLGLYCYEKYAYSAFISHETCQVYGYNFKPAKIKKENYCCRKSEDKNYINCIKIDGD